MVEDDWLKSKYIQGSKAIFATTCLASRTPCNFVSTFDQRLRVLWYGSGRIDPLLSSKISLSLVSPADWSLTISRLLGILQGVSFLHKLIRDRAPFRIVSRICSADSARLRSNTPSSSTSPSFVIIFCPRWRPPFLH